MTGGPGPVPRGHLARDPAVAAEVASAVAAAVAAVPGVAGLHPGAFGEAATHLPHRTLPGVRLGEDGRVAVHVTALPRTGLPAPELPALVDAVRTAAARAGSVTPAEVDVVIEDVTPASHPTEGTPPS